MTDTQILIAVIIALVLLIAFLMAQNFSRQNPGVFLEFTINHIKIKGIITMIQLTSTQQVSGQLQPTNRLGAPAPVEAGSVIIQSGDSSILAVETDPDDETKFRFVAKKAGVVQVDFAADADIGEGVASITGFVGVEVVPAQAQGFGVSFGQPEEQ